MVASNLGSFVGSAWERAEVLASFAAFWFACPSQVGTGMSTNCRWPFWKLPQTLHTKVRMGNFKICEFEINKLFNKIVYKFSVIHLLLGKMQGGIQKRSKINYFFFFLPSSLGSTDFIFLGALGYSFSHSVRILLRSSFCI